MTDEEDKEVNKLWPELWEVIKGLLRLHHLQSQ